jgi:hypothetical protein
VRSVIRLNSRSRSRGWRLGQPLRDVNDGVKPRARDPWQRQASRSESHSRWQLLHTVSSPLGQAHLGAVLRWEWSEMGRVRGWRATDCLQSLYRTPCGMSRHCRIPVLLNREGTAKCVRLASAHAVTAVKTWMRRGHRNLVWRNAQPIERACVD